MVIIDSALVESIPREELTDLFVVPIDGRRDAVEQITTALAGVSDVPSLRFITHGSDGTIWFGRQALDAGVLTSNSASVAAWGRSLADNGDILLFGCSVADSDRGRLFVEKLGRLTQADIAASTNITGKGGDTDLEFQVGEVTTGLRAKVASYERANQTLAAHMFNYRVTRFSNNQNGTAFVEVTFDMSGNFYLSDGMGSTTGPAYLYVNGSRVAQKTVAAGSNLTISGNFALNVGTNEFRVDPQSNTYFTGASDAPATYPISAPSFYGFPTTWSASSGTWFQALYGNISGTREMTFSATGLPLGLEIGASDGFITGTPTTAGVYHASIRANNGFGSSTIGVTFTITNEAPGFANAAPSVVSGALENTPFTITYAALAAQLDDTDPNSDVISFRIESVLSGTLTKNGSSVVAGSTWIAPGESIVWTPTASYNGARDAFTVKAYDGSLYSATMETVQIAVAAVNDAPTFTTFSGPVATGNEDSPTAISFAALAALGNQADIDNAVTAFVVKEVTTGTLKIGTSEATATPWNATTNKAITGSVNGYWIAAPNANGPQSAFKVVARDGAAAESATPVQAVVSVTPVSDAPTLTSIGIISGQTDGAPIEISSASLVSAGDESDVDGDVLSFRLEAISSGVLQKWNGSAWAAVVPGTTLIATGETLLWTPAGGSSGLQNAFTVKAWDGQLASATAIQVQVDAARWTVSPWTNEVTSGLDPKFHYTHAYSFGSAASFTLGGVAFTGVAGANPAVVGKLATRSFGSVSNNDSNNLGGASRALANDFISTSAAPATIRLDGLTPGARYVLSLFSVGFENGDRNVTLQGAMGQVTVNEDAYGDNNGLRIDYKYLAAADGSATLAVSSSGFHLYGLTNREYSPTAGLYPPANLTYDDAPKPFQVFTGSHNESSISAGIGHTVLLKSDGTVSAYGWNGYGQTNVPPGLANVAAVSAGGYHTLALKSDGSVVAWGGISNYATVAAGLTNVVAVSAGKAHSLALKTDGTVVAWGSNSGGQLNVPPGLTGIIAISAGAEHSLALKADGTVTAWGHGYYDYATPPAGLVDVVAVSAGEFHSLALKSDGSVVAWGNNGVFQSQVPAGLKGVIAISAGTNNSVAVKSDGSVVSWGDRDGTTMNSLPSNIPAGLTGVVAIDAGGSHVAALKSDGTVVTWGSNSLGQRFIPAALNSLVAVSTGRDHTLALRSGGTVLAWGGNSNGQSDVPAGLANVVAVEAGDQLSVALKSDGTLAAWGAYASNLPAGVTGVVKIAASGDHVLALKTDGTVVAWGENRFGQSSVPSGLSQVIAVAAAEDGSLALKADGTVVYWGYQNNGQAAVPSALSGVKSIAAASDFFLALKSDGTVVGWGDLRYSYWNPPAGLTGVVAIEAGEIHALALKSDGSVVAWGSNLSGQLNVPESTKGVGVVALAAGYDNSIALKSDGTILLWGGNYGGKNSPPAATRFPAVGNMNPSNTFSTAFTSLYQGRGATVYGPSATAPSNAGDYTVTTTDSVASVSRTFTIAKVSTPIYFNTLVKSITYGTTLGGLQLDSSNPYWWNNGAFTEIAGTRVYSPAAGTLLGVGTHTLGVTFIPTDSVNFNPSVAYSTVTVTKATVASGNITLTAPSDLTYSGSPKSYLASATNVGGFTYIYTGRAGTSYGPSAMAPTYAGNYTATATVNDANYQGVKSLDFTISKITPVITTKPLASAITYTQTLASSVLSGAVTSVPGSFAFSAPGTAPDAGTASHALTFTPADIVNYNTAGSDASVTVNPLALSPSIIAFTPPASLTYSGTGKAFTAAAAGLNPVFAYNYVGIGGTTYAESATPPINAGTYSVTATATSANHSGAASQTFEIAKAAPTIAWATPANISYGTSLSATQLNASAGIAGAMVYSPASGAVLDAGARTLSVAFTPTDTANYNTVTKTVPLQVNTTSLTAKKIALYAPTNFTYDGTAKAYAVSQMPSIAAGFSHSLSLKSNGTVVAWGWNSEGQTDVPSDLTGAVQVSAGNTYSMALKSDGKLVGWGSNSFYKRTGVPDSLDPLVSPVDRITNATAVAAGGMQTVVLRADGTVAVLGSAADTSAVNVPAGLTGVTAVASGWAYAVALKSDGTVVAWGDSDYVATTVPSGLSGVVAVAAGSDHTLALKADGTVVAWGRNTRGQSTVPSGLTGVVAIAASQFGSFALRLDGSVVGWGITDSRTEQIAAPGSGVVAIAAGAQHLVMLKSDGSVTAVGSNNDGQTTIPAAAAGSGYFAYSYSYVGRAGTTYPASASAPVNAGNYQLTVTSTDPNYTGSKTVDFTIAKATPTLTSLPVAAVITQGQALSSATLSGGAASVSGTYAFSTPAHVPGAGAGSQSLTFTPADPVNYNTVTTSLPALVQGTNAATPTIASTPSASAITFGQKLDASVLTGGSASVPGVFVFSSRLSVPNSGPASQSVTFIPTDIANYKAVTLAVLVTVYDGVVSPLNIALIPPPGLSYDGLRKSFSGSKSAFISMGTDHTLVLKPDGTVAGWGTNYNGSITIPGGLSGVVAVAAGLNRSLALKADGTVVGWGSVVAGENVPAGLSSVVAISTGGNHNLALKSNGTVVAWGYNPNGQCDVPAGLSNVVAVAAMRNDSVALKSDGSVVTWGGLSVPAGLNGVVALASGPAHVIALKSNGTVVAWGNNFYGQTTVPAGLTGVVAVSAGNIHSAALKADGTVVTWGYGCVFAPDLPTVNLVPAGLNNVVAIAAGSEQTTAVKADGSVVFWGYGSEIGTYRVNGEVYRDAQDSTRDVPIATVVAGVQAGFDFSYSYGGRDGTTYATSSTAPTDPGNYRVTATCSDPDFAATKVIDFTITKGIPVIATSPVATSITFGQTLASSTLNAGSANIAGGFAFATPGIAPIAGNSFQSVVFTPGDATKYVPTTFDVSVSVTKATPTLVTRPTATTITYGQTLAASELANGLAGVPGSFSFSSPATTGPAGTAGQGVTFTPADSTNYNSFTTTVDVLVTRATPTILAAPNASAITFGQTLADSTLNGGAASVAGGFAWAASYTAPGAGTAPQGVVFTPDDTANYASTTGSVNLAVNKATPTVTVNPVASSLNFGQTLADSTLIGGEASVAGSFAWTYSSTEPGVGTSSQEFVFTPADPANYNLVNGTAEVVANPLVATLTLGNLVTTYDGTPKSPSVTTSPAGLDVILTYNGVTTPPTEAGTYTLVATIDDVSHTGSVSQTFTIETAAALVTATARTKTYGMPDPELSYEVTGIVASDTAVVTGALVREAGENAGLYPITQGSLDAGRNYHILFTAADLAIQAAEISSIPNSQLRASASSVVNLPNGTRIRGLACDGSRIYVNLSAARIGVYGLDGSFLASHPVENLPEGQNQMAFAGGFLFARNGDSIYRISTVDWSSTLVAVDDSHALLTSGLWMLGSLFDTPDGRIGVMGETVDGHFTVRLYQVQENGLFLVWDEDHTLNDSWITDEHGSACDGDSLYRLTFLDGCKTYDLATGSVSNDGAGWDVRTAASGESIANPTWMTRNHRTGDLIVGDFDSNSLLVSAPSYGVRITAPASMIYDGTRKEFTAAATGLSGLLCTYEGVGETSYVPSANAPSDAGDYTFTVTSPDPNYTGSYRMNFTIQAKTLALTATPKTKIHGAADPSLTYACEGLVGTDALTGNPVRAIGEDVGTYAILQGTLTAGANYAINFSGSNLSITAGNLVSLMDLQSSRVLQSTTDRVLALGGAADIRGLACDGTNLYVNTGGASISVYRFSGALVASHNVANLPVHYNQMAFAGGYLFARNGTDLYRISITDWTSTLVSVDPEYPLLWISAGYLGGSLFDTPDGQLGVMGPISADGATFTVRIYRVSADGSSLTWERDYTINNSNWHPDEHGMATDGTCFFRLAGLSGYKSYDLATGKMTYDGMEWRQPAGFIDPIFLTRNHFTGQLIVGDLSGSQVLISAATGVNFMRPASLIQDGAAKGFSAVAAGVSGFSYSYVGRNSTVYSATASAPTDAGDYTVTAVSTNPNYGILVSEDFAIRTIHDEWRFVNFGTTSNSGSAADDANPSGDGMNNLLKYALGLNANQSGSSEALNAQINPNRNLALTFIRARSDLTYTVEASNDLINWSDVAVNPGAVGTAVTVTDEGAAPPNAPKRYLRLKVSR